MIIINPNSNFVLFFPLCYFPAAYFGHLEIVECLLEAGIDINQSDSHNKTALYVATYHGRTDIVNLLIRNNACVNTPDKNGKSPLYIAVLHGNLQIAEMLIKGIVILLCLTSTTIICLCPLYYSSHRRTDGRKPTASKLRSLFVFVHSTCMSYRQTNGNLATVISLTRHLSLSVVLLVPRVKMCDE